MDRAGTRLPAHSLIKVRGAGPRETQQRHRVPRSWSRILQRDGAARGVPEAERSARIALEVVFCPCRAGPPRPGFRPGVQAARAQSRVSQREPSAACTPGRVPGSGPKGARQGQNTTGIHHRPSTPGARGNDSTHSSVRSRRPPEAPVAYNPHTQPRQQPTQQRPQPEARVEDDEGGRDPPPEKQSAVGQQQTETRTTTATMTRGEHATSSAARRNAGRANAEPRSAAVRLRGRRSLRRGRAVRLGRLTPLARAGRSGPWARTVRRRPSA